MPVFLCNIFHLRLKSAKQRVELEIGDLTYVPFVTLDFLCFVGSNNPYQKRPFRRWTDGWKIKITDEVDSLRLPLTPWVRKLNADVSFTSLLNHLFYLSKIVPCPWHVVHLQNSDPKSWLFCVEPSFFIAAFFFYCRSMNISYFTGLWKKPPITTTVWVFYLWGYV